MRFCSMKQYNLIRLGLLHYVMHLRQYRTELVVQMRSQIFRQIV